MSNVKMLKSDVLLACGTAYGQDNISCGSLEAPQNGLGISELIEHQAQRETSLYFW